MDIVKHNKELTKAKRRAKLAWKVHSYAREQCKTLFFEVCSPSTEKKKDIAERWADYNESERNAEIAYKTAHRADTALWHQIHIKNKNNE